ncbi:response regulator [Kallotenue papyrolyticum]|uniref:response regulator n=1 Tax=Kallotenue papyrolyticum TaxID=1325125 RepID=UPI00046F2A75|nr:response regulator [Kallotenue papyrolyticum]
MKQMTTKVWRSDASGEGSAAEQSHSAPQQGSQRPVLLIEDDPGMRLMLLMALEDAGYEVVLAEHGRDGQRQMAQVRPRLILLDMRMPVMDGPAFLHWLYSQIGQPPPVILMTAYHDVDPAVKQLGLPTVSKPMRIDDLLELIRHHAEPS